MVDNFALLVSQLMLIVVLWRCFVLPPDDRDEELAERPFRAKRLRKGVRRGEETIN